MGDVIAVLNAGSSSVKFALATVDAGIGARRAQGEIEGIGTEPRLRIADAHGTILQERDWSKTGAPDQRALLDALLGWIEEHLASDRLVAVGHRVVHGGSDFAAPVRVTPGVLDRLAALTPLAPLHQPMSLAPIRAIATLRPELPQVACFDTAFHRTIPDTAARYALPRRYEDQGVRRYGFHGLSYDHVAHTLRATAPSLAQGRVVVAHLGNGASLCAMRDGHSIDTTMGFSALDGLVMGTRCGAIDPGILLYLLQHEGLSPDRLEHLLYRDSGLRGVSGLSSDMRTLANSRDPHAREAIDLFVYRIVRETGALVAALGGLDGFVFTGGIGEHDAAIRAAVCAGLGWLGLTLDDDANRNHAALISTPGSRVEIRVIPADEESVLLRDTLAALG